jgi:CheY-like chemotaxis protein
MFLFTRLLKAAGAVNALHIALDGQDAIRLLAPVVEKSRLVAKPSVIFLDSRMPRLDGLAVLEWIRARSELDDVPVVIMSGAADTREITRAHDLGAQCFLIKYPGKFTISRVLEQAAGFSGFRGNGDGHAVFDLPDNLLRRGNT